MKTKRAGADAMRATVKIRRAGASTRTKARKRGDGDVLVIPALKQQTSQTQTTSTHPNLLVSAFGVRRTDWHNQSRDRASRGRPSFIPEPLARVLIVCRSAPPPSPPPPPPPPLHPLLNRSAKLLCCNPLPHPYSTPLYIRHPLASPLLV